MMKTQQKVYYGNPLRRNFLITLFLINLIGGLSSNTFALDKLSMGGLTKSALVKADTVKMIAGVPLNPEDISPLLVGELIPQLNLLSSSGKSIDLNKSVAAKPTILVFYRGGWCPYCSKQLSGLQEIEKDLAGMGYQVIAISTDSPENLNKLIDKEKLSYLLLSDANLHAAKKFGIAYKSPKSYDKFLPETSGGLNIDKLLPVPSVFILNKKGMILFEYINPNITQRLSAALLKAAAMSLR